MDGITSALIIILPCSGKSKKENKKIINPKAKK